MKKSFLSVILVLFIPLELYGANDNFLTLRNLILKIEQYDLLHRSRCEIVSTLFNDLSTNYDLGFTAMAEKSIIHINADTIHSFQCRTDEDLLIVLGYLYQYEKKIESVLKYYHININLEKYFCDFLISRIDKVRNSRITEARTANVNLNKKYDFEYQLNDDDEYEISWVRNKNCDNRETHSIKSGSKIITIDSIPTKYISNCIADSLFFQKDSVNISYLSEVGLLHKTFKSHTVQKESPYVFTRIDKNNVYLKVNHFFEQGSSLKIAQELLKKKYDRIIIDLRDNTGGYIQEIAKFTGLFLKVRDTIIILNSNEKISTPVVSNPSRNLLSPELIILINSSTASGANLIIQMLRKARQAIIIGENSIMDNSIHSAIYLPPKMFLVNLTVATMEIKRDDITPDYHITDCLNENGDNIYNFALNFKKQN